jgi:hypothetical protein
MSTYNISAGPLLRHGPVADLVIEALDEAEARRLAKSKIPSGWQIWRASEVCDSAPRTNAEVHVRTRRRALG